MKKIFLRLLAIIIFVSFSTSCSKNDDSITRLSTYKNLAIDKIGKDTKIGKIVKRDLELLSIENEDFNFGDIQRTSFDFFKKLNFYLIPFSENSNKFIGYYKNGDNKIFTIVEKFNINSKSNKYVVTDLNNKVLYEYTIDENFGLQNINAYNSINLSRLAYPANFDCGTLAFGNCMSCGFDVCSQDWRCEAAAAVTGPAFVAGLAIVCGIRH